MKRTDLFSRLSLVSVFLISSCAPKTASEPQTLRACYSATTATQVPLLYAFEMGFFDEYGLDVELTFFESGTSAATAMIADETDICQIAGSSVVNAAVAGEDLVLIAGMFNTHVYHFVVTPDIKSAEDLRGGAVAVSRLGSSSDSAIRIALESMGLTPDQDVAILEIGGQSARVAALETGQIVGTVVSIPASTTAVQAGFPILLDMATLDSPYQHTAIATSRSFLSARRDDALSFMQALVEAIESMKRDRDGTIEVMAKYMQLDPVEDLDLLSAAYDDLIPNYLPDNPYPTLDGLQTLLNGLAAVNPDAADFQADDLVDLTLLDEILGNGDG